MVYRKNWKKMSEESVHSFVFVKSLVCVTNQCTFVINNLEIYIHLTCKYD
jgi:hypothetical protein